MGIFNHDLSEDEEYIYSSQNNQTQNQKQLPPKPEINNQEPPKQGKDGQGFVFLSVVFGVLSMIMCCGCYGIFLGITAIVMGKIGMDKTGDNSALAGIICGSIGIMLNIIYLILAMSMGGL